MKTSDILKIVVWEIINSFILNFKKNKIYHFNENYTGLNLGCGIDNPPTWLGIDGGASHYFFRILPKTIVKMFFSLFNMSNKYEFNDYFNKIYSFKFIHFELRNGIPFNDNTIPNIYSSHFFEHIFKEEAEKLLLECNRVLKKNGLIRICVPSLDDEVSKIKEAIKEYENKNINNIQKYVTTSIVGYNSYYSNHRYMYNYLELKKLLKKCGFRDVNEREISKGKIKDVEILDTREGIFVEARK